MSRLTAHTLHANISDLVREETLDNEQYMVVPCILINEGVWNGVMYPASELSKHVEAWNGRPLVLGHPTVNGKPVTANSKKVKETKEIGLVLNTAWDPTLKALKAEAWINKAKCKIRAPKVLEKLENEEQIDVSTGLFTDDDMRANEFNGKSYECVALNHRPDHLAILPDSKGACSWNDGAGLCRINEAADGEELDVHEETQQDPVEEPPATEEVTAPKTNSIIASLLSFFGFKSEEHLNKIPDMKLNEASLQDRMRFVEKALQNKINPAAAGWGPYAQPMTPMPWILEVYENWLVYNLGDKKYSVDYKFDKKAETVEFTSEPEEVIEKRVYTPSPKANGGPGSGNFGHSGIPGQRGGSGGGDEGDGFGKALVGTKAVDAIEKAGNKRILVDGEEMSISKAKAAAKEGYEVRIESDAATRDRMAKGDKETSRRDPDDSDKVSTTGKTSDKYLVGSRAVTAIENVREDQTILVDGTAMDPSQAMKEAENGAQIKIVDVPKGKYDDGISRTREGVAMKKGVDADHERFMKQEAVAKHAELVKEATSLLNRARNAEDKGNTAKSDELQAKADKVMEEAKKLKDSLKKNEFLNPSGLEQPPLWANQEGSPNMDKQMKVNELITNGALDASLRETMMAAPEAVVTAFGLLADKASAPKTLEKMIEQLSPEEAKKAKDALALKKAKDEEDAAAKAELAKNIKGNSACKLTAEQVDGLDLAMLKNLSAMLPATAPANHAAAAGGAAAPKANADDDTPPEMLSIDEVLKANASK